MQDQAAPGGPNRIPGLTITSSEHAANIVILARARGWPVLNCRGQGAAGFAILWVRARLADGRALVPRVVRSATAMPDPGLSGKASAGRLWPAEVRMTAFRVRASSDGRSAGPVEAGAVAGGSSQS
jgi:hypothetical protein